jgi:hypothetical protein
MLLGGWTASLSSYGLWGDRTEGASVHDMPRRFRFVADNRQVFRHTSGLTMCSQYEHQRGRKDRKGVSHQESSNDPIRSDPIFATLPLPLTLSRNSSLSPYTTLLVPLMKYSSILLSLLFTGADAWVTTTASTASRVRTPPTALAAHNNNNNNKAAWSVTAAAGGWLLASQVAAAASLDAPFPVESPGK